MLWFDVERRYKTIYPIIALVFIQLWFDVERRYKTIHKNKGEFKSGCGLM